MERYKEILDTVGFYADQLELEPDHLAVMLAEAFHTNAPLIYFAMRPYCGVDSEFEDVSSRTKRSCSKATTDRKLWLV